MKRVICHPGVFRCLIAAIVVVACAAITPLAKADVVYSWTVINDGIFGSYSWSFSTPTIFTSSSGLITSLSSVTPPIGCTISSVQIENPQNSTFDVDTNFNPACHGFVGEDLNATDGPATALGTYGPFNANPPGTATLTISQTPEPASLILLGSGLAGVWIKKRQRKAVQ